METKHTSSSRAQPSNLCCVLSSLGKRPLVAPLQEFVKYFVKYSANEHTYIDKDNNIPSVFRSSTYYSYQREKETEGK